MTTWKIIKESVKAGLVLALFFGAAAGVIAGAWWEPAWRRMPDAPDKTYPLLAAILGFVTGFIVEYRRRKNYKPYLWGKNAPKASPLDPADTPAIELWDESRVRLEERVLQISGKADEAIVAGLFKDFAASMGPNRVCCFVFFTYADLPVGKEFEIIFRGPEPRPRGELFKDIVGPLLSPWSRFTGAIEYWETRAVVAASTQQMGIEREVMSYGWKTITILEFPEGIPEMIDRLPTIDQWYGSGEREHLRMCNADTFEVIKEIAGYHSGR